MAIFLREDDVIRLLPINEAIEMVEQGFKEQGNGTGVNLPRERAQAGSMGMTMMVAALGERGVSGFKAMGAGKPLVLLYGGEPRQLLAVMEAGSLGQIRTGAASGVATKYHRAPFALDLDFVDRCSIAGGIRFTNSTVFDHRSRTVLDVVGASRSDIKGTLQVVTPLHAKDKLRAIGSTTELSIEYVESASLLGQGGAGADPAKRRDE